jgi:hypothetical protein
MSPAGTVTGDGATAVAHGSAVYRLEMSVGRDAGKVALSCTCPYPERALICELISAGTTET